MYLLKKLKEVREDAKYTLRELGDQSSVAYTTISALENLQRKSQLKTVKKLAAALEVETKELVGPEISKFVEIKLPIFATKILTNRDNLATVRSYEMGDFILLVRQQIGKCSIRIDNEPEISSTGWRVTVFHPLRWASSWELEAATQIIARRDLVWFSGIPASGCGDPPHTTLTTVQDTSDLSD